MTIASAAPEISVWLIARRMLFSTPLLRSPAANGSALEMARSRLGAPLPSQAPFPVPPGRRGLRTGRISRNSASRPDSPGRRRERTWRLDYECGSFGSVGSFRFESFLGSARVSERCERLERWTTRTVDDPNENDP